MQQDIDAASLRIGTLLDESVVVDYAYSRRISADPDPEFQIVQTGRT